MAITVGEVYAKDDWKALTGRFEGEFWLLAAVCILLAAVLLAFVIRHIYKKHLEDRMTGNGEAAGGEELGETTLDLTEQVDELKKYAGELRTLVDIGYYSSTEVIE